MVAETLVVEGAGPAVVAAAVGVASFLTGGKHGGSGKTHARVRAAKAQARARHARTQAQQRAARTGDYEAPVIYQTQPSDVPLMTPGAAGGWGSAFVQVWAYLEQMRAANEAARAQQQAAQDAAAWYASADVYGPPGPYEAGSFFGLNFPLIPGSRQDPRGIRAPGVRATPFLVGVLR